MGKVYQILKPVAEHDLFVSNLIMISKAVKESGFKQLGYLGVFRNDYMVTDDNQPKLVEMNTFWWGLSAISDKMPGFYDFMMNKYSEELQYTSGQLPTDCHNVDGIADSFKQAFELYKYSMPETSAKLIVAFIVDHDETSICDQKHIESALYTKHRITCRRLTFADVYNHCELTENGKLTYK